MVHVETRANSTLREVAVSCSVISVLCCSGKQRNLRSWLAGGGSASQRSISLALDSEDSLPDRPLSAAAAAEADAGTPDVMASALPSSQATQQQTGVLVSQEAGNAQMQRRAKPLAAFAAASRKGKRPATAAGAHGEPCQGLRLECRVDAYSGSDSS